MEKSAGWLFPWGKRSPSPLARARPAGFPRGVFHWWSGARARQRRKVPHDDRGTSSIIVDRSVFRRAPGGRLGGRCVGGGYGGRRAAQTTERRRVSGGRRRVGRFPLSGQHQRHDSACRFTRPRRGESGMVLRLPGLFADAGGVPDGAVSRSVRRARGVDRSGATEPRRTDDRRRVPGRRVRDRVFREMAQRQPMAVSPQRAGVRRVLRVHLGSLGGVFRSPVGAQRRTGAWPGFRGGRFRLPGKRVHRGAAGQAVPVLRGVQHTTFPVGRPRGVLVAISGQTAGPEGRTASFGSGTGQEEGERRREPRRNPLRTGDGREPRRERGTGLGETQGTRFGSEHDRPVFLGQRPEYVAVERRDEGAEGDGRRRRRAVSLLRAVDGGRDPTGNRGAGNRGGDRPAADVVFAHGGATGGRKAVGWS